ncbi:lysosomal phospholipase A and acyltransferase-like [Oculina patagonica]
MLGGKFIFHAAVLVFCLSFCEGWWKKPTAKPTTKPTAQQQWKAGEIKTPVIIVPGSGGSQIEGKLDKPSVPSWYCEQKTSDYFTLWLEKSSLLPYAINCWTDNMRLVYDEKTNTVKNAPGVETRVPGFGDTATVEYVDTTNLIAYFKPMVDALVSWGYERGVSVRAAPYDFRYAPESTSEYNVKLKKLIEDTYSANGNKKITLMSHSLGCPYTLVFLNTQTQDWKDKYILQWIALAGVYGGTAEMMGILASGYTLGIPNFIVDPLDVREQQRTSASNAMMMPSPELWNPDEVLVKTPERVYTVNDYDDFFKDIGFPQGIKVRNLVKNRIYPLSAHAPNVPMHCLYGTGVHTPGSYIYGHKGEFPDTQPEVIYDDGDGTVSRRSLEACSTFSKQQDYGVTLKEYHSVEHQSILGDTNVINYVKSVLF